MQVFKNQFLDASGATIITSEPIPTRGNKVVMSVTVINHSGIGALSAFIDGTCDGLAWEQLASVTGLNSFANDSSAEKSDLDVAAVRVRATIGASGKSLFDVALAFSEQ